MLKKLRCSNFALLLFVCFAASQFSACSWRLASSVDKKDARSIAIPYVEGDSSGRLTNDLVEEVEKQTGLVFSGDGGELTLKVVLVDNTYDNIGFRFDPKQLHSHKHEKKLIPNETRQLDLAEVTVIDNASGAILLGPAYILSSYDYDHQNYTMNNDINVFSLGQLSDIDTAIDALDIPRYNHLAQEIAQYLENNFDKLKRASVQTQSDSSSSDIKNS